MLSSLIAFLDRYRSNLFWLATPLIFLMIVAVTWAVYATGGIKFVYSHSMYVPIVLAALAFGIRGAMLTAVIAGLALGPYMPVNVETGEMQETINWLYRTGFFLLIGTLIGAFSDIIRLYIRRMQWRLHHDPETELPNRNALNKEIEHRLIALQRKEQTPHLALLLINLDDIQDFELRLGNHFSSSIIKQLAARIEETLGSYTITYQTTHNHLALLIDDSRITNVDAVLNELNSIMLKPCYFEKIPVLLDYNLGSVLSEELITYRADEYLQKAELCVSQARRLHHRSVRYEAGLEGLSRQNIELLGAFKNAFDDDQLSLHFQPKIQLSDRSLAGAEALLRWRRPDGRYIPPAMFIPQVEQSDLIHNLTHWVLEQTFKTQIQWREAGVATGPLAVNISPRNLLSDTFVDDVLGLLEKYGIHGADLELEVTEGAFMKDIKKSARTLKELSRSGISVAIDDFGTGYSSLQYLDRLPVTTLKLDKFFVQRINGETSRRHMVEHTVRLAHSLGLIVVAEGIETEESAQILTDIGCDLGQGYLFCRPLPAKDFANYCSGATNIHGFPNQAKPSESLLAQRPD